jgi:hypothetical protein
MVDYIDANGHLIISIMKNKDGKCIAATFQPAAFKDMIKSFGGEVDVETVKFYIEGDGGLMASLANQLQGGGPIQPMRQAGPGYYPQQTMYQPLPQTRNIAQVTADDLEDDEDDDEDDEDDDADDDADDGITPK